MAVDVAATVRACSDCAKNRVRLRKRTNPLKLFPPTQPLTLVAIDILGPLTMTTSKYRHLLGIVDRFSKLTQVVPLLRVDAYVVAVAFSQHWLFKYGVPDNVLSDNGKQFASQCFQGVCQLLGASNSFTSSYHAQTNGQAGRFNRTILAMLRCYVNEH